jgi:hypothetical protein
MEPPVEVERSADFDADVRRTVQLIARRFEHHIARAPGQWVMFHEVWPGDACPERSRGDVPPTMTDDRAPSVPPVVGRPPAIGTAAGPGGETAR